MYLCSIASTTRADYETVEVLSLYHVETFLFSTRDSLVGQQSGLDSIPRLDAQSVIRHPPSDRTTP